MTQMLMAKNKKISPEMSEILKYEKISKKELIRKISKGEIVIIPGKNNKRNIGLGNGLRSKILCNIGTSTECDKKIPIIELAQIAEKYGASIICDQSLSLYFIKNRSKLINSISLPVVSIPLYQNVEVGLRKHDNPISFSSEDVIKTFKTQVINGNSSPGIHPITKKIVFQIEKSKRLMPYVSRGGTLLSMWIKNRDCENPYIEYYDEVLEICVENDVPLTFVCATRSGCLKDGFDNLQVEEWKCIRNLVKKAHKKNVSAIIDGIGHLRLDLIPKAVQTLKRLTYNIPIGVMGPAVTDRALGLDHIAHVIGATEALSYGANYAQACSRTEHMGLPQKKDITESVRAYKVAVYAADLVKLPHLRKFDDEISIARQNSAWGKQLSLALEPQIAREIFRRVGPKNQESKGCSICGELCPFKIKDLEVKEDSINE